MSANGRKRHRPELREDGTLDLTLFGFDDTDLFGIIDDLQDENGWTRTVDVRIQVGEDVEDPELRRRSGVPQRLAWMKRYGWLEQDPDNRSCWRLTAMGRVLYEDPDLSRELMRALKRLSPAQRLRLTRELGQFGQGAAPEVRTALRRQWTRALGR